MRTVFLKELRENARWAGAIFVVILLVVYSMMRRRSPFLLYSLAEPPMLVFAPLAGLLMGVVQSLFETKSDNWAFVVHRPVSRFRIFAAKSMAGLALLFAALELPCLMAAAWAARPGNLRISFAWPMLLPSLALVLSTGCYYFVGVILTLRNARWWGTRLLPVGFAVACGLAAWIAPEFWQALAIISVGCAVAALAALESFATAGTADRGVAGRLALGAVLSTGAFTFGLGLVAFSGIFQSTRNWSWWRLDRDGNVLRVTTTLNGNQRSSEVTDASGRRVPELSGVDLDDPAYANRFVRFEAGLIDVRLIPWPFSTVYYDNTYRKPQRTVVPLPKAAKAGVRMRTACLFNQETHLIELYDPTSRRPVGTVGPAGFSPARSLPPEPFPGRLLNASQQANTHALAFESAVYWMELDRRRVTKVFTASAEDSVVAATELPPATDPTIVVGTLKHLYVMRPTGELISTAPLEPGLSQNFYSLAMLPNRHLVIWSGSMSPHPTRHPLVTEMTTDSQPRVVRQTEAPTYQEYASLALPRTAALASLYPAAALPVLRFLPWGWLFDLGLTRGWFFQWCVLASGLSSAAAAILLSLRYGRRRWATAGWALTALALGPCGVIALVGLNEMPARETCAACGRTRLAGKRTCARCFAQVSPPGMRGWEIMEPVGVA